MSATYDADVVAWANEQAALLRSGQFHLLDIEHIADEVEDVGKSEERELESRTAVLIAHMLKWAFQARLRSRSWSGTIRAQRKLIVRRLDKTPSLRVDFADADWLQGAWVDGIGRAVQETGMGFDDFPPECIWSREELLDETFLPE